MSPAHASMSCECCRNWENSQGSGKLFPPPRVNPHLSPCCPPKVLKDFRIRWEFLQEWLRKAETGRELFYYVERGRGCVNFSSQTIAGTYQPAVPSSQKQLCSAKCSDLAQCCISTHVSKLNVLDWRFCNPVFWVIRVNFLNRHGLIISWQLFVARDQFLWLITLWLQIKCTQAVIGKRADNKE